MSFMHIRRGALLALALIVFSTASCTVKNTETPLPSGPSGLALTLTVTASPDNINQDGGSQSSIRVTAIGPDGRPVSGLPLRMEIMVGDQPVDFGTLSARTVVTNSSGVASVIFTAPPSPPSGQFGTCRGLPGTCVSIVAIATGTNFAGTNPESVQIRLTPTGVIVPSPQSLFADFVFHPDAPVVQSPVQFDASTSCGEQLVEGKCPGIRSIVQYSWNFGDGQTATGRIVSHLFAQAQTYVVTLTITNDLGASVSASKLVTLTAPLPPEPNFEFAPPQPHALTLVSFVSTSATPSGAQIVSYSWIFGDGSTCPTICGTGTQSAPNHSYPATAATTTTYNVVLTVTDSNNQTKSISKPVIVTTP